jgi:hypothetical protein
MTISIEVGKIKITSDSATTPRDFLDLIDQLTGARLNNLLDAAATLETGLLATPATVQAATTTPTTSAIQTVTTV